MAGSALHPLLHFAPMHRPLPLWPLLVAGLVACDSEQAPPVFDPNSTILVPDAAPRDAAPPAPDYEVEPDAATPDSEPPDEGPPRDAASFEQVPFAIETRVGDRHTPIGLENRVTCEVLDRQGAPIPGQDTRAEIHPDTGWEATEIGVVGRVARDYRIVCTAPALGLRDPTPADWTVLPGPSTRVVTTLSDDEIAVGESTEVTCEAFDAEGNRTDDEAFDVRVDPQVAGVERRGSTFTFTAAGTFDVTCTFPGADSAPGVTLVVRHGLPANIAVGVFPERPVYRVGEVVELLPVVTDRFENPLPDAPIVFESDPALPAFGAGRFRCAEQGRFLLAATVDGPTFEDRSLEATREILVDFGGPGITCDSPGPGEFIALPEGGQHTLTGSVADIQQVQSLRVDGVEAPLMNDGSWRADVPVRWGLNVHDVTAFDGQVDSSTFCAYYASGDYHPEDRPLDDAILLRLGQGALDEGDPDRPLGSIADVLRRVVNSRGMRDTVHQAALAQNPIVPNECHARVLGLCVFRLGVDYTDLQIGGRNTLQLTLVQGGLRVRASIREVRVSAQIHGTLGRRATVRAEHITFDMTFDVNRRFDGNPNVQLRSLNEVSVGDLDADFSGILGWVFELVFEAFEGLIRRTIVDALRDFLRDNIDRTLEDLLSNVDLGELAQGFDVPGLTGGPPLPLVLTASLNRIDFAPGRAMLGVSTKVDGPVRVAGRSPGVPLPPGTGFVELPADRSVNAAVMLGLLNQVMHRLWRGGYFDAEADGLVANVAGDLPEGTEVTLRFPSPPVVTGVDGEATVRVFVGPLTATIVEQTFFFEGVPVQVAAALDATVRLQGERDLVFEGVEVSELHLAIGSDPPERARQVLEDTLTRVLQGIVDRALNDGLPVLPLPEFVIPQSLGQFDLPVGNGLGLRQPRLTGTEAHWRLDGNFGER